MDQHEVQALIGFLASGLLAGAIAHWVDMLVSFIRKG